MADVKIYRTNYCSYCDRAERLLDNMGVEYEEIDVTHDEETRDKLVERTGQSTVPQIFINDESIGGYDELREMQSSGELKERLDA